MPCDSSGYPDPARAELDRVMPLLCWMCERAVEHDPLAFRDNIRVAAWWDEHQEYDRKREAVEQAQRERGVLAAQAYGKLTIEERAALGIR